MGVIAVSAHTKVMSTGEVSGVFLSKRDPVSRKPEVLNKSCIFFFKGPKIYFIQRGGGEEERVDISLLIVFYKKASRKF